MMCGNTIDCIDHPLPKHFVSAHRASHHAWAPGTPPSKSGADSRMKIFARRKNILKILSNAFGGKERFVSMCRIAFQIITSCRATVCEAVHILQKTQEKIAKVVDSVPCTRLSCAVYRFGAQYKYQLRDTEIAFTALFQLHVKKTGKWQIDLF